MPRVCLPLTLCALLLPLLVACGARGASARHGPATSAAASPAAVRPGTSAHTLIVGGRERSYTLHLPPMIDTGRAVPLVLLFHGSGGEGSHMAALTGMNAVADRHGFAVAYPDGVAHSWNDGRFAPAVPAQRDGVDDVGFVAALVESLARTLPIDRQRVYATGISNGGMLTEQLGCDLAGTFAAIAPVAGPLSDKLSARCAPARPLPVLLIAGAADPLIPWAGGAVKGSSDRGQVLSAAATVSRWVGLAGCATTPTLTHEPDRAPNDGTTTRRETYVGCRAGAEVILYAVDGGGHSWPGGRPYLPVSVIGPTSRDFDASETIWAFFAQHSRP